MSPGLLQSLSIAPSNDPPKNGSRRVGAAIAPFILAGILAQLPVESRAQAPPAALTLGQAIARNRKLPISIDFGPGRAAQGSYRYRIKGRDPGFAWSEGMVREVRRESTDDRWFGDFIEGEDAVFVVAVDPPDSVYRLIVTLGDPERPRGPVTLFTDDRVVADTVTTGMGERREIAFEAAARNGFLRVRLQATECSGFAVNGIQVSGPAGAIVGRLFPLPSKIMVVPPPESLRPITTEDALLLLRDMCDFLITNSPRLGGFSYHGAWYQNAYPIRTLMAGSLLLGNPAYAEAAVACLDWFVSRQGADGNWLSAYFWSSACDSVAEPDSSSANLADIGTMTACLSMVAPLVDPPRAERYLRAAELYARKVSLPNQLPDGAFANRRWSGKDSLLPYSIATATQTMSLQALFNATSNPEYRAAAEKGAGWLADRSFLPDGRVGLYSHDRSAVVAQPAERFGDVFYIAEALTFVYPATVDDSLRSSIEAGFDRWLFGEKGLRAVADYGYWWPSSDPWSDSKMGGMLHVLATHPRSDDPVIRDWLRNGLAWIADPARRQTIGVTACPADAFGTYALAATGFSGLGVAEAIRSGVLDPIHDPVIQPAILMQPDDALKFETNEPHKDKRR
jgi:hypothetical protein